MISHMIRRPIPTPPKNDEPVAIARKLIGEVGCGNEKGISSAREETTVITWTGLDFGRDPSGRLRRHL